VATGGLSLKGNDSAMRLYVLQIGLYNKLKADSSLVARSSILQSFMDANNISNIGDFYRIDSLLNSNDTSGTLVVLSSLQAINKVDRNYLQYYQWMLSLQKGKGLAIGDTSAIFGLGQNCPSIDGTVVFAARNLYNSIIKGMYDFGDRCTTRESAEKKAVRNIIKTKEEGMKVWPNPSRGEVNISFAYNSNEFKIVRITDILGKTVVEKEVKPGESNVKMQVNSISGMLFVKVTECKSGKVESKKILIKQ